jgi:hypothetical protein
VDNPLQNKPLSPLQVLSCAETDLKFVHIHADTLDKREFVKVVFGGNLYYQDSIYRTSAMHNGSRVFLQ